MTVRAMNKKTVQATLKQLKAAGYKVEGKKGWYKAFDGDTQVFYSNASTAKRPIHRAH